MLLASATGCGSKSGDESGANAFASSWADCTAYCQQQASCGIQDEAQCTAVCSTPVELTTAAIASANLAADDLRRCEDAWKLSDSCNAGLSCTNLMASQSQCSVQQSAAQNNCSLVISAIDLYARAHPATPFFGPYTGTYDGTESGSLSGVITPWGRLVATIDSPAFGMVPTVGTIKGA